MADTRILLLGCNGQLGFELNKILPSRGLVTAHDYPDVDFSVPASLRQMVRDAKPDVIVNAAAYTAVDRAECEESKALAINAEAPRVLAEEADRVGAVFVHYSTDYVFDGRKSTAYVESDPTNPLSVYGRTKRDGEWAVAGCRKHLIFRTSWVFGAHGSNFIKTMLRLAAERDTLQVVADQFGAPTAADLLAYMTREVLDQMKGAPTDDARWGLYHLVAAGDTSWNGLARRVIARAASHGLPLKASASAVSEIATADYPAPAKRPANSRLDTCRLRTAFGLVLPNWTEGVDRVLEQIVREMGR